MCTLLSYSLGGSNVAQLLLHNADSPFVMSAGITVIEKLYLQCIHYPL